MEYKADYLDYLASHDSLTAIPNRRAFFESAHRCLKRSERSGKPFALLVIDLNDFKQINDERGHKVGDAVLQHFAVRLTTGFRETDFVGRVGGDEFAVVLEPVDSIEGVERVVERFRSITENQVEVDGVAVSYECAIGSALYPEQGQDVAALFEAADSAMYRSKHGSPTEFLWK